MFIRTRRTLAGLTAVAAFAGAVGTQAATAPIASAAPVCKQWQIPKYFKIDQSNGWHIETGARRSGFTYKAYGYAPGSDELSMVGKMKLNRFDVRGSNARVEFTIAWSNGSGGDYSGKINDRGFLKGYTFDQFNEGSSARWNYTSTIDCA
jgi:hypothetical protein